MILFSVYVRGSEMVKQKSPFIFVKISTITQTSNVDSLKAHSLTQDLRRFPTRL